MSRRAHVWKPPACTSGKGSFRTQGRAIAALAEIDRIEAQAAVKSETRPDDWYKCQCGAFHLRRAGSEDL
jgi:hypothetical protein